MLVGWYCQNQVIKQTKGIDQNQTFIPVAFDASNTKYVSLEIIPLSIPLNWSCPSVTARLTVKM